ncbi:MAG: translation elongation factor Ts [Candidatus Magasanikbacteria bacterium RIFCSPLOWO2_02_FULL_44_11]|uniref:Elongation factor Ts n=2 Tax=Candidatus Magasanikiibacteriota TaxID=1752731 RepID=A0A1F6NAQ3_9BACT|nr:MAG: translation elongation factor Ts [Candidatus Magasanikbacteria bacterium RIFCSPLOWO2_02_FULL_44_11]
MAISAADISKLRASTGAGMLDCKNALEEAGGDMEKAAEILRKKGIVKAAKRADKVASEGRVVTKVSADDKVGALVELNCETDFVGRSDDFNKLAEMVAEVVVKKAPADLAALNAISLEDGKTIEATIHDLTLKIGEKISLRRFARFESAGLVASYMHGTKIGVLVDLTGGTKELGVDVAMHAAASNPKYLNRAAVPSEAIAKEKEIFAEQLRAQGKPANIIENILKGKIDKYYGEVCLVEQPFIKNEELTVQKLLDQGKATLNRFVRFELGEGIEKASKDFASEVAEQLK